MVEHPEACPEWQEDLAAWLVAQIAPDREAALVAHLDGCATCRAEADGLLAVAAVALAADPDGPTPARPKPGDLPPADLGARIDARIDAERGRSRRHRAVLVAAAAAVVLVAGLGVAVTRDSGPGRLDGEQFAFLVGDGHAVVAADGATGGAVVELVARGLDPDVTYALWLSAPGGGRDDRVPAGTFRPDPDGDVDVRLLSALPAPETGRVWATATDVGLVLDTEPPG